MKNHILLITDIFGETSEFQRFANSLREHYDNVETISPYSSTQTLQLNKVLHNEQAVYQFFVQTCGHEQYALICSQFLEYCQKRKSEQNGSSDHSLTLVAFSAGASAMWRAVSTKSAHDKAMLPKMTQFIGFYPSQIRHHTQLTPSIPSLLIFPDHEPHFNVDSVITNLEKANHEKQQVWMVKTPWLHGFFNIYSEHYCQDAFSRCKVLIEQAGTRHDQKMQVEQFLQVL